MKSRHSDDSLWSNNRYRNPLLSYIGKIYGQKGSVHQVLGSILSEKNELDDLDLLNAVVEQLAKQPG
jgi:hypothetical protein